MARKKKTHYPLDLALVSVLVDLTEQSGRSRRELERLSGLSLNRIGIILRGETPAPTLGEINQLAIALNVSMEEIYRMAAEQFALAASEDNYDAESEAFSSEA